MSEQAKLFLDRDINAKLAGDLVGLIETYKHAQKILGKPQVFSRSEMARILANMFYDGGMYVTLSVERLIANAKLSEANDVYDLLVILRMLIYPSELNLIDSAVESLQFLATKFTMNASDSDARLLLNHFFENMLKEIQASADET